MDACPLCGGEMEPCDLDPDRKKKMQKNNPELGEFHAVVCTQCGHISYRSD